MTAKVIELRPAETRVANPLPPEQLADIRANHLLGLKAAVDEVFRANRAVTDETFIRVEDIARAALRLTAAHAKLNSCGTADAEQELHRAWKHSYAVFTGKARPARGKR